jgi:hypothetical protein
LLAEAIMDRTITGLVAGVAVLASGVAYEAVVLVRSGPEKATFQASALLDPARERAPAVDAKTITFAATDAVPAGASPSTSLAYAGAPNESSYTSPQLGHETPDSSHLTDYVPPKVQPPEVPTDSVGALKFKALSANISGINIPEGTSAEEVRRAAQAFGLDGSFMEAVAMIESDFDPKQRTGAYTGLFQLSKSEFDRFGSGEITNARDNAIAGAYKFAVAAVLFELQTHKKATLADLYLIHQQGPQGAAEHVSHPDRLAWQSMCATDEGKAKGESWCKRAIWQNTLPEVKKAWGSVDKLTSAAFVDMWRNRVATLYQRYLTSASVRPSQ